jgi:hypothetical protein
MFRSDAAPRLQAYDLLTMSSSLFEKENDDWQDYELSLQPFIHQLNIDLAVYIKKNVSTALIPRALLETDEHRVPALIHLARRTATNHQKFAGKLFRECIEVGDRAPFTLDIAVVPFLPRLMRKIGARSLPLNTVFDHLEVCASFSSLRYLAFDHLQPCLERISKEPVPDSYAAAFEYIVESCIGQVTRDIVDLEFRFIENFMKAKIVDAPVRFWIFGRVLTHIANQILDVQQITEWPPYAALCLQFCVAAVPQHPELFHTGLQPQLASFKFNQQSESLPRILELPAARDFDVMTDFFRRIIARFPEKAPEALRIASKHIPDVVASVLMEAKLGGTESLTLFCYQVSDPADPILFDAFKKFVSEIHPDIGDINQSISRDELIKLVIAKSLKVVGDIVVYVQEHFNVASPDVMSQVRLIDVISLWLAADQSQYDSLIGIAIQLSKAFLPASSTFVDFWQPLLASEPWSFRVFR